MFVKLTDGAFAFRFSQFYGVARFAITMITCGKYRYIDIVARDKTVYLKNERKIIVEIDSIGSFMEIEMIYLLPTVFSHLHLSRASELAGIIPYRYIYIFIKCTAAWAIYPHISLLVMPVILTDRLFKTSRPGTVGKYENETMVFCRRSCTYLFTARRSR